MPRQRAFTFTELLIAVAVLALLAAGAVPRFFAINKEMRIGDVDALAANVQSSAELTNRIWVSNGRPASLSVDGRTLDMRFGYPTDHSISEVVVMSGEFLFADGYWRHKESSATSGCAVLYIPPPNPDVEPVVITYKDGC